MNTSPEAPQELQYPAEFHFRVIVDAQAFDTAAMQRLLGGYTVTSPLGASRPSASGHYHAYALSILMHSQAQHHAFDHAVKQIPGIKIIL